MMSYVVAISFDGYGFSRAGQSPLIGLSSRAESRDLLCPTSLSLATWLSCLSALSGNALATGHWPLLFLLRRSHVKQAIGAKKFIDRHLHHGHECAVPHHALKRPQPRRNVLHLIGLGNWLQRTDAEDNLDAPLAVLRRL